MLTNEKRREILETARAVGYKGSVLDLYNAARAGQDISQLLQPQNMEVAQTPEQQSQGLRPQHAAGNTNASMAFPNVPPNTPFNTKGMKAPINISKFDEQGHLVQSFKNVPPGIESLPTGPGKGTVIETPAYKKGGYRAKFQPGGFKEYYQSLPETKNDTSSYNLRRAFELAPKEDLEKFATDPNAHLKTFYFNDSGVGEFMKSPSHPTVNKELDFYYSDTDKAKEFRSKYDLIQDRSGYKYIPKYQEEEDGFEDGMRGMMKARIALDSHFGNNPAIQRMIVPPDNSYKFDDGTTGTHYMSSYGNYAIPDIQDVNGKLERTGPRMNEAIRFDRPEDAIYFAKENYKDVGPAFDKSVYPNKYQFGGRQGDTFQEVDTYIKPGQSTRPNWAQTPDAVTNYTFGKNLVDDESRFSLGLQGTDILDEIKYRADLIGSGGIGIGNRKGKSFRPAGENLRAGIRGQASWQGVPGNVLENMFPRSGVNVRGSFEGEAGLGYANGAISPYMSVTPQTNFSLNDNLSLGVGYEMRGRYDKNRNNPIYGSTGTGTIAPLSQRDAYSGMGRGAGRLSLKYDMGDGDFIEGYYSKPNSLYQGSMYPVPGVIALENEGPRFGVRLKKSF